MKVLFGALLMAGGFMLVPMVQQFAVKNIFGGRRKWVAYIALLSIVALIFAIFPVSVWRLVVGSLFVGIGVVMLRVVPRNESVQKWMEESLFSGNNILDETAPYAKVVSLFKLPIIGLGFWIIAPWSVVLIDVAAIIVAFYWWYKCSSDIMTKNETKKDVGAVDNTVTETSTMQGEKR